MDAALQPLIAVIGPTASGKSELALEVAERVNGEIVNYDSVQLYRGFNIGAAKLALENRRGIPHHLLDSIEPHAIFTAGDYAREARAVLEELKLRGKTAILVGGTGFYLSALTRGLFAGPTRDDQLRERLEQTATEKPSGYLKRLLTRLDRQAAERIHANDTPKLVRAIEVSLLAGRPISEQWQGSSERLAGFQVLTLGLSPPRKTLYEKINARAAAIYESGLIEEVEGLLESGISRDARPFTSLGYAQCLQHLDGRLSLDEAIEATAKATRRYAKRQLTWFRHREPDAKWFEGFGEESTDWATGQVDEWLEKR